MHAWVVCAAPLNASDWPVCFVRGKGSTAYIMHGRYMGDITCSSCTDDAPTLRAIMYVHRSLSFLCLSPQAATG